MKRETVPTSPQYQGEDKKKKSVVVKQKICLFDLLFIIFLSFIGGICGSMIINNYPADWPLANKLAIKDTVTKEVVYLSKEKNAQQLLLQQALIKIEPSIVNIYNKKDNADIKNADLLGSSIVLTSDGWLASSINNLPELNSMIAIANDKTQYSLEKIINDQYSGIVFIKCSASNLIPAQFADLENVDTGDEVFAVTNSLYSGLRIDQATMENNSFQEEQIFNTQKHAYDYLISNNFAKEYLGSPLVNERGEVLGLNILNNLVVPHDNFSNVMPQVITNKELKRINLNFEYYNLDNQYQQDNQDSGIKITSLSTPDSGLLVNDVVLKVDGQDVNKINNLTQLLQEYQPGDTATFSIIRGDAKQDIIVNL